VNLLAQSGLDAGGGAPPELTDAIWGLLFIGGLVVAALIWLAVLRRTSRRQLESIRERERALQEHYRDLFENAHDILFAHDDDGQLSALNRAGEEILGYTREEAVRVKFTQLIIPEDRAAYFKVLDLIQSSADRGHAEVCVTAKAGNRVALRINLRRQALPGRPAQVLGIAWDITQRRLAEDALRESEQRLRHSLEERIRIGRDLHDGIIQSIYAVGLGLGECRRMAEGNQPVAERLDQSITELNTVIRDVRNFIGGLEPEALKGREFGSALKSIAQGLGGGTLTEFRFDVDPQAADRLNPNQAAQLLQIAREAMTNALRHGHAPQIAVSLRLRDGSLELEIQDDGTGFDPDTLSGTGLGLGNIKGRAAELGGRCGIDSLPSHGTTVRVEIPIREPDAV
jgi:PAS domain S-box-containing protein